MTENATPISPELAFDLDDWLTDATLPQQSADVFKAGQLPAEAGALKQAIEIERGQLDQESSAAEKSKLKRLEARYAAVLQEWLDSKITVYVTALTKDRLREIQGDSKKKTEGMEPAVANEIFGYNLLAAAIIGVAVPGREYVNEDGTPALFEPVSFTMGQVRGLEKKIGATQMQLILAARQTAQNGLPEVDADFLLESSGSSRDGSSD